MSLNDIKTRLKRATPGPWCYQHDGDIAFEFGTEETVLGKTFDAPNDQNDAEFIAHAREDIERLVACVEMMREGLEKLSEFTDQSVYLITTDSLSRADKILGLTTRRRPALIGDR